MSRRKNPHPQRAVNVKTVVVGDDEEEEQEPVLCLQIPPDEDDDVFVVVDDDDDDDDDYPAPIHVTTQGDINPQSDVKLSVRSKK